MLVKVAHPVVKGNDSGFAFIDHDKITPEHQILGVETTDSAAAVDVAVKAAINANTLMTALPVEQQNLAKMALSVHFSPKEIASGEVLEGDCAAPPVIASTKTAKAATPAPAKTDASSEAADTGNGWAKD